MNEHELIRSLVYALYKKSGKDIKVVPPPDNFWYMVINHDDGTFTVKGVMSKK